VNVTHLPPEAFALWTTKSHLSMAVHRHFGHDQRRGNGFPTEFTPDQAVELVVGRLFSLATGGARRPEFMERVFSADSRVTMTWTRTGKSGRSAYCKIVMEVDPKLMEWMMDNGR
jgi:hypothetical protein